jgi:hypothetical protein
MTKALKPCRYCGSINLSECHTIARSYVQCHDCNTLGPDGGAEAWNRAPAVPEGWKLVPRDYVTWEMQVASLSVSFPRPDIYGEFDDLRQQEAAGEIFLAMLAVAPEPGEKG